MILDSLLKQTFLIERSCMAQKKANKVTRIKATDSSRPSKKEADKKTKETKASDVKSENITKTKAKTTKKLSLKKFSRKDKTKDTKKDKKPSKFFGYLKGSWNELKQVRWPDRRSTWAMTGALLVFTAFFITIILLLDYGFKYLFDLIYK